MGGGGGGRVRSNLPLPVDIVQGRIQRGVGGFGRFSR